MSKQAIRPVDSCAEWYAGTHYDVPVMADAQFAVRDASGAIVSDCRLCAFCAGRARQDGFTVTEVK